MGRSEGRWQRGWWMAAAVALASGACAPGGGSAGEQQAEAPPQASNVILASAMVNLPDAFPASELPDPTSAGAQATVKYCAQACHGLPAPSSHAANDWPVVLRRMWYRMSSLDSTYQIAVPTTAERVAILDYMLAHALQITAGDLPDGPGKDLFVQRCGACHGLPDVRQHSADDWVAVVRRMNGRMEKLLGRTLSQDEMQRIVYYLEAASKS